ncbi:MAG: hypothetical protein GXP54_12130 [Deltaproteobacteria bacterium]|nr:hypothetical protein [Deltaproteobacteria bacterium]
MNTLQRLFPLSTVCLLAIACGGGSTIGSGDSGIDIGVPDIQYDLTTDGYNTGDRPDQGACTEGRRLDFSLEMGDDDKPCKGQKVCNIVLSYTEDRDLDVTLSECGAPVSGAAISFEKQGDANGLGQLAAPIVYTGPNGIGSNNIKNTKTATGQFQVKVCVDGAPEIECIYYNIAITPKGVVPLSVGFGDYKGAYPLIDVARVYLFKQGGNGKPTCDDIEIDNLPTATVVSPTVSITQTAQFPKLPNLETEKTQNYTIIGLAQAGEGPVQAYGCEDGSTQGKPTKVEWGGKTYVELDLKDIPPKIVGSYDITNTFDLVSGLPPQVATVVYTITGFFENPAAQIMLLICQAGGTTLTDFCGYMFNDPDNPDISDLSTTGDVAFQIINALLIGILESYCPGNDPTLCGKIYWTASDVSDILTKFQILSTFTFSQEPDETGYLPASACKEVWHTLRIRWTLGLDCPPSDDNCGWKNLSFNAIPGIEETISANFEANLIDNSKLEILPHKLNLKYGALVNFAIEKLLLPQVFGDGSDGLPAVDSYEALIGSLLAGKACLQTNDCCNQFAVNLTNQTFGLTLNLVEGACEALMTVGASYLRDMLLGLDATPDNFTIGTKEPCQLYDNNKDMNFDGFGKKTNPCVWDAQLVVGGATYPPDGTFWGTAK